MMGKDAMNTTDQVELPAATDASYSVYRDGADGVWICLIGNGQDFVGSVWAATPAKAITKAVEVLEGRRPITTLRRLTEHERSTLIQAAATVRGLRDDEDAA